MAIPKEAPVVVVTGASAGVGRAIVQLLAKKHKARIGLIARERGRLEEACEEVRRLGGQALSIPCDVTDKEGMEEAAACVERAFGPLDVWVNNAMVSMMAPFKDMSLEEFHRISEVTYLGYVNGTHVALRRMYPRNHGGIIQVGSALAYRAIPLQSAYCGAKHAILGFTESLRTELLYLKSKVKVCMVQLPGVNTPQFDWIRNRMGGKSKPAGAIFQPEVAADAVVFSIYHNRPELQVTWSTVEAILADKLAPRLLDRYVARKVFKQHVTKIPDPPGRPDNLFAPVPGKYGAHGSYDDEARRFSPQLWLNKNRAWLFLAGLGLGALTLLFTRSRPLHLAYAHPN